MMMDGEEDGTLDLDDPLEEEEGADHPAAPDDDGELEIEIDGEEPEVETPTISTLRKRERDLARENAELRSQLAPKPVEIGERPTLESFGYDEDKYDTELAAWHDRKRQADGAQNEQRQKQEQQTRAWQQEQAAFRAKGHALGLKDFAAVEDDVTARLPHQWMAGAIIKYADDGVKLMYALGKNPAAFDRLAAIDDPGHFMKAMLKMEGKMVIKRKGPPPPEASTILRGSAPLSASQGDKKLKELESKADKSGDRTELIRYKTSLKAKAKA